MSGGVMERIEVSNTPEREPFRVIQGIGEIAASDVIAEDDFETKRFVAVDALLDEKAPFFFGLRGFNGTSSARFRILNRAMSSNIRQTPAGLDWRNTFDSVKSYNRGEEYLDTKISHTEDGKTRIFKVGKLMEDPIVRSEVLGRIIKQNSTEKGELDPAFHIYTYLKEWPAKNNAKPSESEQRYANRTLEVFLYSVHGRAIVHEIKRILKSVQTST